MTNASISSFLQFHKTILRKKDTGFLWNIWNNREDNEERKLQRKLQTTLQAALPKPLVKSDETMFSVGITNSSGTIETVPTSAEANGQWNQNKCRNGWAEKGRRNGIENQS